MSQGMQGPEVTIRVDGFYDSRQIAGRPHAYQDVMQVHTDDGRVVGDRLPPSPARGWPSMRGTLIPSALGSGGLHSGYNPERPLNKRVYIDPHITDQSATLDYYNINEDILAESTRQAISVVSEMMQQNRVEGIEAMRLAGATAMRLAAVKTANAPPRAKPVPTPLPRSQWAQQLMQNETLAPSGPVHLGNEHVPMPLPTAPLPQPQYQAAPSQQVGYSAPRTILESFGPPAAAYAQPQAVPQQVAQVAAQPPQEKVIFEFKDGSISEAYYHRVVVTDKMLVLITDNRFQGFKFFPPPSKRVTGEGAAEENAIGVRHRDAIYKLMVPDLRYTDQNCTHDVLFIIAAQPA